MARLDQVEACWDDLTRVTGERVVPITYMNSTAAIKAFCRQQRRRGFYILKCGGCDAFGHWNAPTRFSFCPMSTSDEIPHTALASAWTRWSCDPIWNWEAMTKLSFATAASSSGKDIARCIDGSFPSMLLRYASATLGSR